jgi:arginine decarboxylase
MLHFFVDTGIKDSIYYWNEFKKCMKLYGELKNICPTLKAINIGGGLPIQNSLGFDYDYQYMINEIVSNIKSSCEQDGIPMPDIYTEFGTFTVGASGAHIFSVLGQKSQNDAELWYMIDNSLMNTLPDTWGIDKRFVILPINKWKHEYARVNVGGMTCDNSDYYNSEAHINQLYLPKYEQHKEAPLYIGFFNTGAYQENISGYGGIKHCLIPSPKHILIDKDENGNIKHWLHQKEQTSEDMLRILGY